MMIDCINKIYKITPYLIPQINLKCVLWKIQRFRLDETLLFCVSDSNIVGS